MFLHTCLLALILETLGSAAMTHILDGKRYYVHPAAVVSKQTQIKSVSGWSSYGIGLD